MKTQFLKSIVWITAMFFLTGNMVFGSYTAKKNESSDSLKYIVYRGVVKDSKTNQELPFATIEAGESGIATVSNIDGEFVIKISKDTKVEELKVSYVGYKNASMKLENLASEDQLEILLDPTSVRIKEVSVRPKDATELINKVLANITSNYSNNPMMMKGFYRETIKSGRKYVSISEAVVDIYKEGYKNSNYDKVKINKGRKSADVKKMDTILFKLQGGPAISVLLDIVKNPYILLSDNYQEVYNFYISDVTTINNKLHYVVSFKQKPYIDTPFYMGKLFIEMDRLAITEAEFELYMENSEEASTYFIRKKPIGMRFIPEKAIYRTSYTIQDDQWYFSYARAEAKFKVNWKKKLFNSTYTTMAELAITEKDTENIHKFGRKETFRSTDVLAETVYTFFDTDFWGEYNVIEPDQSIEQAIKKLNRKMK